MRVEIYLRDVSNGTVYLAFMTYKPEETVTYTEGQRRGDMDTAASGLYEVFKVEHTLASDNINSHYIVLEIETLVHI